MQQFLFLKDLLEKIENVNLNVIPVLKSEPGKDEKVVGVLPDDLKKLYIVMCNSYNKITTRYEKSYNQIKKLISNPKYKVTPKNLAFIEKYAIALKECSLISDIFWHSIEKAFCDTISDGSNMFGLRKNWQVVILKQKSHQNKTFIMGLLQN